MGAKKLLALFIFVGFAFSTTLVPAVANPKTPAPKLGSNCKSPGEVVKVGTKYLFCMNSGGQRTWVSVGKPPASRQSAIKVSKSWLATIPTGGVDVIVEASQPQQEHADLLVTAQGNRDLNAAALNQALAAVQQLQSEINDLPNKIATALAISEQAKAAMQPSLNELKAADATVTSLSSSYSAALNTQYIITAEIILCTFGFRSCTPGQYDAELARANATVSRYESAKAAAAGARAKYDGYYRDYKEKYDAYAALFDRRGAINDELARANADVNNFQAVMPSLDDSLMRAKKKVDHRVLLLGLASEIDTLEAALTKQTGLLSKSNSKSWSKSFNSTQSIWLQLSSKRTALTKVWNELQAL